MTIRPSHSPSPDAFPGMKELALEITTDPDHKFDLSLQLDDLDAAVEIARSVPELEAEAKWKAIGDRALAVWRFDLARESFEKANDLGALMLLLLAIGDKDGLAKLAVTAGACDAYCLFFPVRLHLDYVPQRRRAKTTLRSRRCCSSATLLRVLTCSSRRSARPRRRCSRARMCRARFPRP